MLRTILCCTALVVLLGAGRLDASVSISSAYHWAGAYDSSTGSASDDTAVMTLIGMDLAASYGASSAATHLSRSQPLFDYSFDHIRAPSSSSYARSFSYDNFTVTDATSYTISGTYAMDGEGYIFFESYLYDFATSGHLFYNFQASDSTPDEAFTLGLTGGDNRAIAPYWVIWYR